MLPFLFTQAFFDVNSNVRNAYMYSTYLEFDKAKDLLNEERKYNSGNNLVLLNESYIDFLVIMIGEDIDLFHESTKIKENRLETIKNDSQLNSPYYLFSLSEIYLRSAFLNIKFKQYFKGVYDITKAYSLLKDNQEKFPQFALNKKGLGFLNIIIGSVPKNYNWVLDIANIEGEVDYGFDMLYTFLDITEKSEEFSMYNEEILFLISFLEMNIKEDSDNLNSLLKKIEKKDTISPLLIFTSARICVKLSRNDQAIKILENRTISKSQFPFLYLDYLLGMSKLYKLDYNAKHHFEYFINEFNGSNYIKSAYYQLYLISFLEGDFEKSSYYLDNSRSKGGLILDEDKKAHNDAVKDKTPQINLISARFLYDGGYYKKSLNQLEKIHNPNLLSNSEDYIEYWYRKGRIMQALNKKEKMLEYFKEAYISGTDSKTYFSAMSALQLAKEYEKLGNLTLAKKYYNLCLSMSGFEYQKSIHFKAKSSLNRLGSNI